METLIIALLAAFVLSALIGAVLLIRLLGRGAGADAGMLQAQYDSLRAEVTSALQSNMRLVNTELANLSGQVTRQLSSVTAQLQASTGQINDRMDNAARMVGEVRHGLGELSKAAEQIYEVGRDISGLEDILRAPKLRGGLGEFFLGDILAQCLPSNHFELQYGFSNGARCDAVVKLKNGLVPIDSKFPLENFRRILGSATDEEKKAARRRFIGDCRRHIDSISSSYILTGEGTLDFAIMYIPAENVYYELIVRDDDDEKPLSAYAFSKRVVPVSPNSLYAYLQTVLLGLRGMEINERARAIQAHLDGLKNDFGRLVSEMDVLGRHLNNARLKYDEAQRKASRISDKLQSGAAGPPEGDEAEA